MKCMKGPGKRGGLDMVAKRCYMLSGLDCVVRPMTVRFSHGLEYYLAVDSSVGI